MKILHTSDWHIGKRLYEKDLEPDHSHFISQLIRIIENEQINVLIISGDIFDIAYPSNNSLLFYYQSLKSLKNTCLKEIIITGGNHDSISTLNAPKEVLDVLDITVAGGVPKNENEENDYDKLIKEIKNESGEIKLVVCTVPFLRERDIRKSVAGESFEQRRRATIEGIQNFFDEISQRTAKYKNIGIPVVCTGHLFIAGAKESESEREIYVGNQEKLSGSFLISKFDYFALGHIHKPYIVDNNPAIRYSGSPIPLSFSEADDKKSVVIVDFDKNPINVYTCEIENFRNFYRFKGEFNEVLRKFNEKIFDISTKDIVEIEVREEKYSSEIKLRYQEFTEKFSDIIVSKRLIFADKLSEISKLYNQRESLNEIDDFEVFSKLLDKHDFSPEQRGELENSYKSIRENTFSE